MDDVKKLERKRRKFASRIQHSKGIKCIDDPSSNIVLCNVGQATGFKKSTLLNHINSLQQEIQLRKFIAEKGESHSYLVFDSIESSKIFYNAYNGKGKFDDTDALVYMSYVENVPNNEIICQDENPAGLHLLYEFISQEEEEMLINLFDWIEDSNLKNRQVRHYGYEFRYGSNDVDLSSPLKESIPKQCNVLWKRLRQSGIDFEEPDQLTVNKYSPGQGIPSHVDRHSPFGLTIMSLSLGSTVVMDWRHPSGKYVPVVVPARSLLVMQGEARYDWQHGIQPRQWDPVIETRRTDKETVRVITNETVVRGTRISLTFRKTRSGACTCSYKTLCDSTDTSTGDIEDELASNLEELHVHQVYEQIAGHFSSTRHKAWPRVAQCLALVPPAALVLDLGAGNGKNILRRGDIYQIAGERSSGLLSECKGCVREVGAADCVRLDLLRPGLRDGVADYVICVAVIHHFSSQARRKQAIMNIARVLRPGGRALITVWAKDQSNSNYLCKNRDNERSNELITTVGGVNLPIHENRTQFQHNDLLVPWKLRRAHNHKLESQSAETLLRYYHVFESGELDELCSPELTVESSFEDEGNCCVICRKL